MFAPEPPVRLDIAPDHPVARRVASGGEGRIRNVTRSINPTTKKLRQEIVADDIRALSGFFQLSAPDGGYRVVIIDDADLMNVTAANALLKMLEEPPARALLLLISHQPSGLLPTIRSRCRTLALRSWSAGEVAEAMAQAQVAGGEHGCARRAIGWLGRRCDAPVAAGRCRPLCGAGGADGHPAPAGPCRACSNWPSWPPPAAGRRSGICCSRLLDLLMSRMARTGALGTAPDPQAAPRRPRSCSGSVPRRIRRGSGRIWPQRSRARSRHGIAVNLDPAALVLDTFTKMEKAAPRCHARRSPMTDIPRITDSHCHLDFPELIAELPEVIARAQAAGVARMVTICTKLRSEPAVRAIAEAHAPGLLRRRHPPDERRRRTDGDARAAHTRSRSTPRWSASARPGSITTIPPTARRRSSRACASTSRPRARPACR